MTDKDLILVLEGRYEFNLSKKTFLTPNGTWVPIKSIRPWVRVDRVPGLQVSFVGHPPSIYLVDERTTLKLRDPESAPAPTLPVEADRVIRKAAELAKALFEAEDWKIFNPNGRYAVPSVDELEKFIHKYVDTLRGAREAKAIESGRILVRHRSEPGEYLDLGIYVNVGTLFEFDFEPQAAGE